LTYKMTRQCLLLTAAFDEVRHVDALVDGVLAQTRRQDRWVIVDDGSGDGTFERFRARTARMDWVTLLRRERTGGRIADPLAEAAEARALNWALGQVELDNFAIVGKLDADVVLPRGYLERLLAAFHDDPSLGMAAGVLVERTTRGNWRRVHQPLTHPPAPARLYTTACFAASGGFREELAWDTMDEVYARMRGFTTRAFPDLPVWHLRALGTASGRLRGRARHGECAWIVHYPSGWMALRAVKSAVTFSPRGVAGVALLWGYGAAAARRTPRVPDPAFRRFVREELRARMRAPVAGLIGTASTRQ
jgi:biofilm PGA synthesis N-glycosyltransferase PgaC